MSGEIRAVGMKLLMQAMGTRDEAQRRVWTAADEATKHRRLLAETEARLATEERALGEAQDILRMVWEDFNPRTGRLTSAPVDVPERPNRG